MATSLASQLAQIRAHSTNSLDLKAQKKAHSKSLLFNPHHAANQDFDTLFQICCEGWQELCRLDPQFLNFAGNLFSEQSKQEDRTQMTAAQNENLNNVLEDFMGLIGARLLLKPALKALEWLVRRFRIHEYNMTCMILTFLPYHASSIFSNLLAILPERRPAAFKFLQPYIEASTCPPRHAIVHTAGRNQDFFNAFNVYTLKVCRSQQQYSTLLSFWSSTVAEAISSMLDRSRLGRLELQKQNQEDVLRRVVPFLAEGLAVRHSPDLRVGCYMILTILSSKTNLSEELLTSMMEMVVHKWDDVTHAGLICLVVLMQHKQALALPKKVSKALVAIEHLADDLVLLSKNYKVEKLVLGLILGILKRLGKPEGVDQLRLIRLLLEANLMQPKLVAAALSPMLRLLQPTSPDSGLRGHFGTHSALSDLILCLADSKAVGPVIQAALGDMEDMTRQLGFDILKKPAIESVPQTPEEDVEMHDADDALVTAPFDDLVKQITGQTAFEMSLLSHSQSYIFPNLAETFLVACQSQKTLVAFSELPVLRKSLAMTEPFFVSFFIRIWCGHYPIPARVAAIRVLSTYFSTEKLVADVQVLLPYILHALADPSLLIRRAATELVLALVSSYSAVSNHDDQGPQLSILGKGQMYGQGKESDAITWLPWQSVIIFLRDWLAPHVEEFHLHADQIGRSLVSTLSADSEGKDTGNGQQRFKKSLRASILTWLCSHVVNTPMRALKARLLPVLNRVSHVGQTATVSLLTPIIAEIMARGQSTIDRDCEAEHLVAARYIDCVMDIARADNKESVKLLQDWISNSQTTADPLLQVAVFRRVRKLWPLLKQQIPLGKTILDLAVGEPGLQSDSNKQREALETLRNIELSSDILQSFLQECPGLSDSGSKRSAKRRRTTSPPRDLGDEIKKLSLVLELVDSSATKAHLPLLGGLSKVMAELQGYKQQSGIELHYLELLALNSMRAILDQAGNVQIARNDVRVDVLVDCIRNSTDPQVQQSALLLVSVLASIAPELILHDVMPIFTFVGSSLMKRTDDYSTYVVKQTMDSVIPRIMDSLRKRRKDSMSGMSELLLSFVAAFEHVPPDRRLTLFRSLVEIVGVDECLFALLLLLHDKLPQSKEVQQYSINLLDCYGAETQLQTTDRYLATMMDALNAKPTFSVFLLTRNHLNSPDEAVLDLLTHLILLLGDVRLRRKISQAFVVERSQIETLRPLLSHITDQTLSLSRRFTQNPQVNTLCQKLLALLLGGLPMWDFVPMLQDLLDHADTETRLDALKVFELRLGDGTPTPVNGHEACLGFLTRLSSIINETEEEPIRRVALACVDHIVERFGRKDVEAVLKVTNAVAGPQCLGAGSREIRVTSLLCLSTIVEVAQDEFVPFVPQTLPKVLSVLSSEIEEGSCSKRLHNATYSFFSSLLLYSPWAIAAPDLDLLLKVSHGSANANLDDACSAERRTTLEFIARQIESKECCAALERTWANAMAEGPEALKEHLLVLENLLRRSSKSAIGRQSETFARLLTKAFDLRRIQFCPRTEDSYEEKEVEEVEDASNVAAIAMVTKVNDTIFRPIFVELVEWAAASSAKAKIHRQTTIYGFFMHFFQNFKSIVTNYAALILDDAIAILRKSVLTDEPSKLLWVKVIQTLQECFKHDQDGFWQSPTHFGPISEVLLDQLKQAADISAADELIPSITDLAAAADSAAHHKTLNTVVLQYMRSDSVAVRLAAVSCQQSLTARLGEEWLALLPEMLPFISELQEDDDEKVERETLRWIKQIEEVLGESLTPMLQ